MLGAVAYGLRNLSDQLSAKTVVPDSFLRARMRIRLAILGGVIIGLFQGFGSATLSPLAIAFLVDTVEKLVGLIALERLANSELPTGNI
jgi:hypothetical protein